MHTMRSLLLASLAVFAIPACTQDIGGGPTGGDDGSGNAVCGNGIVETGEQCDDGNTVSGDGCSSTCQMDTSATPRITGSMTPPTLELYNPTGVQLTLTGQGGFTGTANLAYSLLDASNNPITGATVTAPATADLSSGTASVVLMVMVPLTATGAEIQGTLKVDITSTADPASVAVAADIKPYFTVDYAAGTGVNPANHDLNGKTFAVRQGTVVRFKNDDTIPHVTHGNGTPGNTTSPFPHESLAGGLAGNTYQIQTTAITPSATTYTVGCHDHPGAGNAEYMTFTVTQ